MTDQVEQSLPNLVSDETGEYDPRFVLWRKFCADRAIPVESLPGDLDPEAKKLWEKPKEGEIGPK
jgi:hypothetical protein